MGQILETTLLRESQRNGFEIIETVDQLIGSLGGKRTNVLVQSVFNNGEILSFEKGLCKLAQQPINGSSNSQFRLVCETNMGARMVFPTCFYKSRRLWDKENKCPGNTVDNFDTPVAKFYAKCPHQLAFVASIIGHKIKINKAGERLDVCGYDPTTNRMSTKEEDVTTARIPEASFIGEEPVLNPEWFDEMKAAQYIIQQLGSPVEAPAIENKKKNA